jgi:FtsH-binding integral membrane protein|tara:strand:+ start:100 stop:228 length:129 start_codon:yes stop_codon:yes gene_type:complete
MPEIDSNQYEKQMKRDVLIISIIGLIIFMALVLWGIKVILEL